MSDCCNEFEFTNPQGTFYMDGGIRGKDGVTFYPHVSAAGILSWTNDGGKQNPDPVNIKGEDGMSAFFVAEYNVTTYEDIQTAVNDGKYVCAARGSYIYYQLSGNAFGSDLPQGNYLAFLFARFDVDAQNNKTLYKLTCKRYTETGSTIWSSETLPVDLADDVIDNLTSTVEKSTGNGFIELINDYYINLTATPANLTPVPSTSGYRYVIVDCEEGDEFTITGVGGASPRLYAFLSEDNEYLKRAVASQPAVNYLITAPAGAVKLVFNDSTGEGSIFKGRFTWQDSDMIRDSMEHCTPRDNAAIEYEKYYVFHGYMSNNNDWYVYTNVGDATFTEFPYDGLYEYLHVIPNPNRQTQNVFFNTNNSVIQQVWSTSESVIKIPDGTVKIMVRLTDRTGVDCRPTLLEYYIPQCDNGIQYAPVSDIPSEAIAMPSVEYKNSNFTGNTKARTKFGVGTSGDYTYIVYAENQDGNTIDIPVTSGSGRLYAQCKVFKVSNGAEQAVSFTTIGKKGDTYLDIDGVQQTFAGGCGYCSTVNGLAYFSSAVTETGKKLNGNTDYNLIPCCCGLNIDNSGNLTVSTPHELSLTIDGEPGKFDMYRVRGNGTLYNYYTSNPPYYDSDNQAYYWCQPYYRGFSLLTSTDGINWTLVKNFDTKYTTYLEVSCVKHGSNRIVYAARHNGVTAYPGDEDYIYVGILSIDGDIINEYKLRCIRSKPMLAKTGNDALLVYTPYAYTNCKILRLTVIRDSFLAFNRWFEVFKECTQYAVFDQQSVANDNFEKMKIVGNNNTVESLLGSTYMELTFPSNKANDPASANFFVG